jgi:hypothetical protein
MYTFDGELNRRDRKTIIGIPRVIDEVVFSEIELSGKLTAPRGATRCGTECQRAFPPATCPGEIFGQVFPPVSLRTKVKISRLPEARVPPSLASAESSDEQFRPPFRLAQAHRPPQPNRDRDGRLRLLSAPSRRRSMCAITTKIEHWSRENFQQHVLEPIVTAVKISCIAQRRLHHSYRHAGGDHTRWVRGRTGETDRGGHKTSRHSNWRIGFDLGRSRAQQGVGMRSETPF